MNNKFNYFIHLTAEEDYSKFFTNGLYDFDPSYTIKSTMTKIPDQIISSGKLGDFMKDSLSENYSTVFLVKIPKNYFPMVVHKDGKMDVPIPFLYEKRMRNPYGVENVYPVVIPNLIQGCYSKERGFTTNENYCPVFDPSGLKFAYEQLEPIKNQMYPEYLEYNKRNTQFDCSALYKFDKTTGTWDEFVKYYSKEFNVNPVNVFGPDSLQSTGTIRK